MRRLVPLRSAWWSHAAAALFVGAAASCQGVANLDENYVLETGSATGSTGAGTGGSGGARTCPPEKLPAIEPPKPIGARPGGDVTFAVAIDSVDFGEKAPGMCDAQAIPGFNLDGIVSTEAMPACQPPTCTYCYKQCDGPDGIDNLLSQLIKSIDLIAGIGSDDASTAAREGKWSLLIVVRDYNGELDDESVRIEMYTASAFGTPPPAWTGSDDWPIDSTSIDPDTQMPFFASDYGWVSCGLLVGALAAIPINLHTDQAHMGLTLNGGRVVAKILPDGNGNYALQGAFGGLWKQGQIWTDLASFRSSSGDPICTDALYFGHAKTRVCPALDATVGFASPSAPCDAMSVGIGFHAGPILLPTRVQDPAPLAGMGCPPETLPGPDTCAQ